MGKHLAPDPRRREKVIDPIAPIQPERPAIGFKRIFFGAAIALGLAAAVCVGLVFGASYVQKKSPWNIIATFFVPSPQALFGKDRIRVLVVGLDYDYDAKDEEYSKNARTDTILTGSVNFPTAATKPSLGIVSVPRDMLVTYPNGQNDKINGAYQHGGIKNSEAVIADFLGIPGFDRYIILRVDSTKALIDAIGGIDIVPDETMNYDDSWGHLHIHFTGGVKKHMNGEQAVSYSRFRHDECGDPCRIKRQQQVIRTVIAKLKTDKLNDLVHIRDLAQVMHKNVETNFTDAELVSLGNAFSDLSQADISMNQVPYVRDEDLACCGNVIIADTDARQRIVRKVYLDPIVPPVDEKNVAAIPASSIKVEVENGSGIPGLATKMAAKLKKQGFVIAAVANAPDYGHDTTEIQTHSAAVPLAGQRVRHALAMPHAIVSPNPSPAPESATSDVTIIVGRDFNDPEVQASAVK
jgi:LCP family protein required for cell wall assembly